MCNVIEAKEPMISPFYVNEEQETLPNLSQGSLSRNELGRKNQSLLCGAKTLVRKLRS